MNLGGGYLFQPGKAWRIAPLGYAVFANSAHQRGVKLAVLASFDANGWKGSAFLAHFIRAQGEVGNYTVLDTLDVTRSLGAHLELGLSAGFFHLDGEWNQLVGPLAKWSDRWGAWALAYRVADGEDEVRVGRVFLFAGTP